MSGLFESWIEKIVGKKLAEQQKTIDSLNEKFVDLKLIVVGLEQYVKDLALPFDVESNLDKFALEIGIKQEFYGIASQLASIRRIKYKIGRDIFVTDFEDDICLEIKHNCEYALLGVKPLKGNAYGHYRIYEGCHRIEPLKDFTITKSKTYRGIAFARPDKFQEKQRFSIGRLKGKGKTTLALIGWSARPNMFVSAVKEVS